MYNTTIGRFLSEDPLGLDADGERNLYRYVRNRPTSATDPSGLQEEEPVGKQHDLPTCPLHRYVSRLILNPDPKERSLKDVPFCRRNDLPGLPGGFRKRTFGGASGWSGVIPPGFSVGPEGCGTCVGVVLVPPQPDMPTYVLHITATQDVDASFKTVGALSVSGYDGLDSSLRVQWEMAPGYKAVLCGAEKIKNDKTSDLERLQTLQDVIRWLHRWGIPIDKYIAAPSFVVGHGGKVYWITPDGYLVEGYEH